MSTDGVAARPQSRPQTPGAVLPPTESVSATPAVAAPPAAGPIPVRSAPAAAAPVPPAPAEATRSAPPEDSRRNLGWVVSVWGGWVVSVWGWWCWLG